MSKSPTETQGAHVSGPSETLRESGAWQESVGRYARPDLRRTLWALASSVVPFIALWVLMYLALSVSYFLTLALAVPATAFLLRIYMLFHDCTHGSLLRSRRANARVGAVLGFFVFTPFARWRYEHTMHHATASDLDRRGTGDMMTLTVDEYEARSRGARLKYRLYRSPLVMFGIGPVWSMVLSPRWVPRGSRPEIKRSVLGLDVALVVVFGALCWWLGWRDVLLVQAPFIWLAGGAGIWLFYVQHQFSNTYWQRSPDWTYADAAMRGSSYLHLPRVLQFVTANIGFHHVHHLSPKIPNYHLQRVHDANPMFDDVSRLTFWEALGTVRLKLWDDETGRLVTWADARRRSSHHASPAFAPS